VSRRISSPELIGRAAELAALGAALADVRPGQGRLVLVEGDAGVGKTRLVEDFTAQLDGLRVLAGGGIPLASGAPYAPVLGILQALARLHPPAAAGLLPHAAAGQADPFGPTRLLAAAADAVRAVAAETPLVLVVEDLHWADGSTCGLVAFLAREIRADPVLLVVTVRAEELDPARPVTARPAHRRFRRPGRHDRGPRRYRRRLLRGRSGSAGCRARRRPWRPGACGRPGRRRTEDHREHRRRSPAPGHRRPGCPHPSRRSRRRQAYRAPGRPAAIRARAERILAGARDAIARTASGSGCASPVFSLLETLTAAHLSRIPGPADPALWHQVASSELAGPYLAGYARLREAASLLARRRRQEATGALHDAEKAARQLAVAPMRAEIATLARHARIDLATPAPAPPPQPDVAGLTPREREVITLLGDGLSNIEIARTLYISEKTASVHVSNILRKLGVTSRLQAAVAAHSHHAPSNKSR